MNRKQKAVWIKDLLTTKVKQGKGALSSKSGDCCLGRVNKVCKLGFPGEQGFLNTGMGIYRNRKYLFLPYQVQNGLARLNDAGVPFPVIAGFIDTYVEPTE